MKNNAPEVEAEAEKCEECEAAPSERNGAELPCEDLRSVQVIIDLGSARQKHNEIDLGNNYMHNNDICIEMASDTCDDGLQDWTAALVTWGKGACSILQLQKGGTRALSMKVLRHKIDKAT